jgi:hypothetical protein
MGFVVMIDDLEAVTRRMQERHDHECRLRAQRERCEHMLNILVGVIVLAVVAGALVLLFR